jgi:protocatechuate 3,4-dioxygenase beta subunit
MTTDVPPAPGRLLLPSYQRPAGVHPPLASPGYASTVLRAPKQPPVPLAQGLTEITGPLLGAERVTAADADLTTRHRGEPLGERIILTGRVLDSGGRPVPGTLIEIWQANASGRYAHGVDNHDAPLDPNFDGVSRLHDRFRRAVPVRHDQARRLPMAEPPQRLAPGARALLGVRPGVHAAPDHPDVLPGDPLFAQDPIFNSVPDRRRARA